MAVHFNKSGVETQLFMDSIFCQLGEYLFKDSFLLQATEISVNTVPLPEDRRQSAP